MRTPSTRHSRYFAILILGAVGATTCAAADDSAAGINAQPAQPSSTPTELQTVSVIGKGETRQVQAVTREDQAESAPGTSPIKVVDKLPGVNYQSADPFGNYEWAVRISVRGFSQQQMGFTLDDMPLGDMFYSNYNGLHISRAIISENIGREVLSQGTGALDTASSSNLGGTLQFYSIDPANKAGITAAQTVGSDNTLRSFLKLDSGRLATGTKLYLSYAYQGENKWKGEEGRLQYNQVNLKLVQAIGRASKLSVFVDAIDHEDMDYQDLSKNYIARLGYNWDNYYPDWATAVAAAQGVYTHGEQTTNDPLDAAYYAGSGLRRDLLAGATLDARLSGDLKLKLTPYVHHDVGRGLWYTPYTPSPLLLGEEQASPISLRTTEYDVAREGLVSSLTRLLGPHTLNSGIWYEHGGFDEARRFYPLGYSDPGISPFQYASDPFLTQWQYKFNTDTVQFHLQDSWQIRDSLVANFGFKSSEVRTSVNTEYLEPGSDQPNLDGRIQAQRGFLPQAGIVWTLSPRDEVFASTAENMRAFPVGHSGDSPFSSSQQGFDAIKGTVQPETSWSSETGYRMDMDSFQGVTSIYHVYFRNRLLQATVGPPIVGNPDVLANVGSVVTNGAEISGLWHFLRGASWYNAVSYNKSTYEENVVYSDGSSAATQGKPVVDTPRFMYKTELSYEDRGFFANLSGNYMGARSYTYIDDNSAPPQFVADFGTGYKAGGNWLFKSSNVQFNVTNLFNRRYISTVGTNGFTDSDPNGTFQSLQVGAPRQLFVTLTGWF